MAILSLFVFSVLLVACSSNADNAVTTGNPAVTATINMDENDASPTPALPVYSCGAWATESTPVYGTAVVGVYAKFVHNVDGNPEGVDGASAIATIHWPDNTTSVATSTTGSDGLAVFSVSIANRAYAIMKITLVTVTFSKDGVASCEVPQDRAAFFTLVGASSGKGSAGSTGTVNATPIVPIVGNTPTPVPTGTTSLPSPTPDPTKPPKHKH